jgi:hypothetical protein
MRGSESRWRLTGTHHHQRCPQTKFEFCWITKGCYPMTRNRRRGRSAADRSVIGWYDTSSPQPHMTSFTFENLKSVLKCYTAFVFMADRFGFNIRCCD